MKIAAVIPCYNVAATIGPVVQAARQYVDPIVVVDDGSEDRTAGVAGAAGALVLRQGTNLGKGASVRRGIAHVLGAGCEGVLLMDGDGQHDPRQIPVFLERFRSGSLDIVVGRRMVPGSAMPWARRLTNRVMSRLISALAGVEIPDSQCGFRLVHRRVLHAVQLTSERYEIDSELLVKAAWHGFSIAAIPIPAIYRNEVSRIHPVRDAWRFTLWFVRMSRLRRAWPQAAGARNAARAGWRDGL